MADLVATATRVAPVWLNSGHTLLRSFIAGTAGITPGQPFYIDGPTGRCYPTTTATSGKYQLAGVATTGNGSGCVFNGIEVGFLEGVDVTGLNYGALIYLSDTVGTLATAAGTNSVVVGKVVAVSDYDPASGKPSKLLYVNHV